MDESKHKGTDTKEKLNGCCAPKDEGKLLFDRFVRRSREAKERSNKLREGATQSRGTLLQTSSILLLYYMMSLSHSSNFHCATALSIYAVQ